MPSFIFLKNIEYAIYSIAGNSGFRGADVRDFETGQNERTYNCADFDATAFHNWQPCFGVLRRHFPLAVLRFTFRRFTARTRCPQRAVTRPRSR